MSTLSGDPEGISGMEEQITDSQPQRQEGQAVPASSSSVGSETGDPERSYAPDLIANGADLPAGADQFEDEYVHGVYDTIAEHFSNTRYKPWPKVVPFSRRTFPHTIAFAWLTTFAVKNRPRFPPCLSKEACAL